VDIKGPVEAWLGKGVGATSFIRHRRVCVIRTAGGRELPRNIPPPRAGGSRSASARATGKVRGFFAGGCRLGGGTRREVGDGRWEIAQSRALRGLPASARSFFTDYHCPRTGLVKGPQSRSGPGRAPERSSITRHRLGAGLASKRGPSRDADPPGPRQKARGRP